MSTILHVLLLWGAIVVVCQLFRLLHWARNTITQDRRH